MPKYGITIPVAGYVWTEVEANDQDEAIEIAMDKSFSTGQIKEWNLYKQFMKGNVSQIDGPTEIEIQELGD